MAELGSATHQTPLATCCVSSKQSMNVNSRQEQVVDSISIPAPLTGHQSENLVYSLKDKTSVIENTPPLQPYTDVPDEIRYTGASSNNNPIISSDPAANITWHSTMKHLDDSVCILLTCYQQYEPF